MPLTLALYQPDIAGNTGTILRLCACLGLDLAIIAPAGFDMSDRALRRAGMDYVEMARLTRHVDFQAFEEWRKAEGRRLVLFTTKAGMVYTNIAYQPNDVFLFGRESAGVPEIVQATADLSVMIPMVLGARLLNLAVAVGIAAGEARRQSLLPNQQQGLT